MTLETTEGQPLLQPNPSRRPSSFVTPNDLAKAIRNGWQIDPERKRLYFDALDRAIREDIPLIEDPHKRAVAVAQCTRVIVAEQGQALKDVHHIESMQHESGILDLRLKRADEGKPETIVGVQVTPAESLPEPEWLEKRRKILEPGNS